MVFVPGCTLSCTLALLSNLLCVVGAEDRKRVGVRGVKLGGVVPAYKRARS
jgi:hypothetical protein